MMGLTSQILATVVRAVPAVLPHLSEDTIKALGQASYEGVRATYWLAIYDAVQGYLTSEGRVTSFRASAQRAMVEAFGSATDAAYVEGGGELPLDDDTLAWFNGRVSQETGFIDQLFDGLREKRGDVSAEAEAEARAEAYSRTLDGIFAEAKMRGSENITLEFGGDDGKESCPDCQRMKGKRHKISYILAHDLIPKPGNNTYRCNGYNCDHYWFNPKNGERFDG
jgi:hypothetical protein